MHGTDVEPVQWHFQRGERASEAGWRPVDLPHDWSIEDLPSRDADEAVVVVPIRNGT